MTRWAAKIALYRDRFTVMRERVLRSPMFTPPLLGAASSKESTYLQITPLESLPSAVGKHYLLAMLTELEEGTLYLEDLNANVKLDLSAVVAADGIFTDHCIVLVEGSMVDGVFHAVVRRGAQCTARRVGRASSASRSCFGSPPHSPPFAR